MAKRDKRIPGRYNSLFELGIDFNKLRRARLAKVQREMAARDIGALLLTDTISIRYVTGVSVMPLWTQANLAHYVMVPVEGSPTIFEYPNSQFVAEQFWTQVRPAYYWQARFTDQFAAESSDQWAAEIKGVLKEWGVADAKVGIDRLDYHGFNALQQLDVKLTDGDDPLQAARIIKTPEEIELLRLSAAVAEVALYDLEQTIRPGVTENELLATYWHSMLRQGGDWCFTRLIASGYKTNPWFHEAGSKMVRPGDLVGIDTDMIGPEGYVCDISRTFLCGDKATSVQKEAYQIAYDFVHQVIELCRVGT
ncbi:MAG: M24 family metallopeptidase, partial [Anaerolineales bacterium]